MLVNVRLWRFRGRRLPFRDVDNGPVFRGDLRLVTSHGGGDRPIQALLVVPDGKAAHAIPALHEPMITLMGSDSFVLRGIERLEADGDVYGVVQEWRCEVVVIKQTGAL